MRARRPRLEVFAEALFLALMVPGDDEAQAAAVLAEELAVGMDGRPWRRRRAYALERFEAETQP